MSLNRKITVIVATIAVIAGAIAASGWAPVRDLWDQYVGGFVEDVGRERITVTAHFRDSVGLYVGNTVTVLGMPVGKVTKIEPQGTKVVVQLAVNDDVALPAKVNAVTVSPSVVTNRNVELTPVYRGGPKLTDGAVIPIDRTRTPVEIDRVIRAVDELAGELGKTTGGRRLLSDAVDVAARNFKGSGKRLRSAVRSLSGAVEFAEGQRDPLLDIVREVDTLNGAAAKNKATITSFSKNLTTATEVFAEQAPELRQALGRVSKLLGEADELITKHHKSIQATLANARTTTATLRAHTGQLAESVDLLPLTFQNLMAAVDREAGELKVHVPLDQMISDQYQTFCDTSSVTLPGCEARTLGDMGPDLGLTALLKKVIG